MKQTLVGESLPHLNLVTIIHLVRPWIEAAIREKRKAFDIVPITIAARRPSKAEVCRDDSTRDPAACAPSVTRRLISTRGLRRLRNTQEKSCHQ